jgi:ankyrin repeat protein
VLGIAALNDDLTLVHTLLASGASPGGLMPDGEKILPWAIREGRAELVQTMMKAGADPHLKDRLGNSLLHVSMDAGRRDLMELLIGLGADPGMSNAAGETTIHHALRHGWNDLVPKLAAAGADLNAAGPGGLTLLEEAAESGDASRAGMLLRLGANPNLPGRAGPLQTPLRKAFEMPETTWFRLFLDHGAVPPEGNWDSWLWQTFDRRDLAKTRLLLSHGARMPEKGPGGRALLEEAVRTGAADFVKLFLDYGHPIGSSLAIACYSNQADLVSLLLAHGAEADCTRFPTRETLLSAAIRNRHDRIARMLVQHGADARLRTPEGQSCFHLAIARACPGTVKAMLDAGADPNAPFILPVSQAFVQQVRPGVMRWVLLRDSHATPLMMAADSGNIPTTRYLREAGAKVNVRTRSTALWPINFASRRGDVAMMRFFLGRDPDREERVIEIRLSEQKARMYDAAGNEIFVTKVSTGRKGYATPTGEYVITNKYRNWTSTLYDASMPYFQRFSCGDFGLHQGNVPGYPASHGCIRVPAGTAAKLFSMTQTGDRVVILP